MVKKCKHCGSEMMRGTIDGGKLQGARRLFFVLWLCPKTKNCFKEDFPNMAVFCGSNTITQELTLTEPLKDLRLVKIE